MPKWTDAQQDAIDARGGNILVSAAAGSGKTAVLIERVSKCITDPGHPVDIDRLLIVTFTNAAAAEMRSRLSVRLRQILAADPGNANAKRQLSLLSGADICTIDAFCLKLVRENFFSLNLAADFRLLDENENDRLFEEAIDTVLTEFYEEADPDFLHLTEAFTTPDKDRDLFGLIKELMRFMNAQAFPFDWLEQAVAAYDPAVPLMDSPWYPVLKRQVEEMLETAAALVKQSSGQLPPEPAYDKYAEMLADDRQLIAHLQSLLHSGWDAFMKQGFPVAFTNMPRVRKDIDPDVKAALAANRDIYKTIITKDIKTFLVSDSADYAQDTADLYPIYRALLRVVQAVERLVREKKDELGGYAFSDVEHFAIDLLMEKAADGTVQATALGRQLQGRYAEILVDEYQDTNEAQDRLFAFLSNGGNRFMVGDVKQSIYRFRLAMPQIFMAKKDSYTPYNRLHPVFPAAITLDKNFRSRAGVCTYVNQVFSLFMTRRVGELDYTQSEYLNPFDSTPPDSVPHAALHILDAVTGKDHVMDEPMAVARLIAKKVQSGETVQDGDSRRPLRYGDFAILMRSMRAHAGDYAQALQDLHIPVVCDNATGLFENGEIQLLLSYLQVIDNPMQDIPLLAVLSSPIYGATEDELAEIKLTAGYGRFYSAVFHPDNSCRSCCAALRKDLSSYKKLAVTMPVEAFIRRLIRDKSLFAYIRALGDGQQRQENVETFLSIAGRFDQNGGLGLAAFLRYVDSMIRGDGKTDSAPVIVTDENAVKIMSVHHSKGLEFPVCILAGAGRKYNMQDLTGKMLLHPQLGLATKCHQEEGYFDYPTLPLEVVKRESRLAAMSENLRVLYVAMTRAKSQFISFASVRSLESRVKTLAAYMQQGKPLPHLCSKLLYDSDFLLMSALCHPDGGALREMATVDVPVHPADFALQVVFHTPETEAPVQTAERETAADPRIVAQIREKLDYTYPYAALSKVSGKRNASALDEAVFTGAYVARSVPAFLQPDGLTPAEKGTAMHTFMQYCDYAAARADLEQEIARVQSAGYLRPEEAHTLDRQKLTAFFTSPFGARVFGAKAVYRELKVASFLPVRALEQVDADDPVFVQGIADCVFEEPEGLVLLDYKTDRVKTEEELLARYRQQLMFYKTAVARTLQKPVHAVYLYSFCLSKPCEYK